MLRILHTKLVQSKWFLFIMGNKPSAPAPASATVQSIASAVVPAVNNNDFSLLPICFGKKYNEELGVSVIGVKKFEYLLFIGAEASRLAYCDVGILKESLKAFGLSPDILNKVISHYDSKYSSKKFLFNRSGQKIAPDSYEIQPCPSFENDGKIPLVRYISSPTDTTCMIMSGSTLLSNPNNIISATDCMVVFKGSSSLRNWEKNLRSIVPGDLAKEIQSITTAPPGIMVAKSFVTPIVEIFGEIISGIKEVSPNCTRIFVFGHSKGGAEAELAGTILSLCKSQFPNVLQVHVISYGSPKIVSPSAKYLYNQEFLVKNAGNFTLTRIESVGTLVGDTVTDIPPGIMVHPGWGDKTSTIDSIRSTYGGVAITDNKRNPSTWPFYQSPDLWDILNKFKLDAEVQKVIGESVINLPVEPPTGGEHSTYFRVRGSRWAPNPHMEYFGMFFLGSQRLPGMANPAKTQGDRKAIPGSNVNKIFIANIFPECTKYKYVPWNNLGSSMDFVEDIGIPIKKGGAKKRRTFRKNKRSRNRTRHNKVNLK